MVPVLIDFGAVKGTMTTVVNSQRRITHSIVLGNRVAGAGNWETIYASDLIG